ncbi:MAG: F-box/WD40 repeat-containing protein [Kistimonas sp.]|nr:F-box/WD40 repeat-containing protein [Kistimonas sp.]
MNISPDRAPGRPQSAAQPGPDQPAPASASSCPKTDRGRSLTLVSAATTVPPGQHETARPLASASRDGGTPTCLQAGIQSLPGELLGLIFDCLALSTHSQCALVCRRWHANLPGIRRQIAQWLESMVPSHRIKFCQLAASYSQHTGPLLARQGHELFPLLERQHQELVRLLKAREQPCLTPDSEQLLRRQARAARGFLSGLIAYSLQHPQLQAGQLSLKPVNCQPPLTEPVLAVAYSLCTRWLAVRFRRDDGLASIRLYGWHDHSWHEQSLVPTPVGPVAVVRFARQTPDRLLTVQDSDIFVWRPAADSGHWCRKKLYGVPLAYKPYNLMIAVNDDLISLSRKTRAGSGLRIQISVCLRDRQCWEHLPPHHYSPVPRVITHQDGLGLVALLLDCEKTRPGPVYQNSILIWGKGLDPGSHHWNWGSQLYRLKDRPTPVTRIKLSPDGQHLLSLTGMTLCLWQLDTHKKVLRKKLELPGQHFPPNTTLTKMILFRADGKQLVVPSSPQRLQLWNLNACNQWRAGTTVEIPPTLNLASEEFSLHMSLDGRLLARKTDTSLLLWQRRPDGQWQLLMRRPNDSINGPVPQIFLRGCYATIQTTAKDPQEAETRLWIQTPGPHGQLVTQAQRVIHGPIVGASPDGLTLLIRDGHQVRFHQLTHPEGKGTQPP